MKRIIHITSSLGGGAGMAVRNIVESLESIGSPVSFITKEQIDCNLGYIDYPKSIFRRILNRYKKYKLRCTKKKSPSTEFISYMPVFHPFVLYENSEIIHLHWVSDFVALNKLTAFPFNQKLKVVWTLHDFNAITGGCHYLHGCEKYLHKCSECPQLISCNNYDPIRINFVSKELFFQNNDVHLVCTSSYVLDKVKKSYLCSLAKSISLIGLAADCDVFKPYINLKSEFVNFLSFPSGKIILGICANNLEREVKGLHKFIKLLNGFDRKNDIHVVSMGAGNLDFGDIGYTPLGNIALPYFKSLFYNSIDYFVSFSDEEAFGQTIIESLYCGTPVISTEVGCALDVIDDGFNGFLISNEEQKFNAVIGNLLNSNIKFNRSEIRKNIIEKVNWNEIALQYSKLYDEVFNS